jgi:phosphatidylglycerol---prolipoprotein diacylglyceryl transferase
MAHSYLVFPTFDPAIHVGPLAIHYYALTYIVGIVICWWLVLRLLRDKPLWAPPPFSGTPPATQDQIGDLVVWIVLGMIIGGRLGWVLIYGTLLCSVTPGMAHYCDGLPQAFATDPIRIIAAWQGGMSFHGGLLGVVLATWLFCRRNKLNFLAIGDILCAFTPLVIFSVRLGNFINGELWGRVTDVPWAMIFPRDPLQLPRHPSQLYEAALEGLLLLAIMQIALRLFGAHRRPGLLCAIFFAGYGTFRFICEWFREPDAQFIGQVSMGMALSIPVWLGAAALLWAAFRKSKTA